MNFEPLNYYSAKRIREDKAFTIELPVTPQSAPDGTMAVDGSKLPFSVARIIGIYGSFKYADDLYIFRRSLADRKTFAYTTPDGKKVILIKD
jgi:hypothetical protein